MGIKKLEVVKKCDDYIIYKRRNSKRYCVRSKEQKWINGEEKVRILLAEKLISVPQPKKKDEAEGGEADNTQTAEEQQESAEEQPSSQ